jgi:hypothetical protein
MDPNGIKVELCEPKIWEDRNTGLTIPPLHIEIRRNGALLNPNCCIPRP